MSIEEKEASSDTRSKIVKQLQECTAGSCHVPNENSVKPNGWTLNNLDESTSLAQNLEEEMARIQVLKSYRILDSDKEPCFERITGLAARIFDVPIALVSLVDLERQWFMSNRGLQVRETHRNVAFCAHAILSTLDLLIVPDATKDVRFKDNGLVTGDPHIRFYAGAPLVCPEGFKLGTLCIIDTKIRENGLSFSEKQTLRELAALVVEYMVKRKEDRESSLKDKGRIIACTAHDLLTPLSGIELNLSLLNEDENLKIDDHQRELIDSAMSCSEVMSRICHECIDKFRGETRKEVSRGSTSENVSDQALEHELQIGGKEENAVFMPRLFQSLRKVIETYPKKVPLTIDIGDGVPQVIISDDLKIFRSALNLVTNACKFTDSGAIILRIFVKESVRKKNGRSCLGSPVSGDVLVFECEDTATPIAVEKYSGLFLPFAGKDDTGLDLCSVSTNVSSLNGEYGYHPREKPGKEKLLGTTTSTPTLCHGTSCDTSTQVSFDATGNVFWFSVPIILPISASFCSDDSQKKIGFETSSGTNDSTNKGTTKIEKKAISQTVSPPANESQTEKLNGQESMYASSTQQISPSSCLNIKLPIKRPLNKCLDESRISGEMERQNPSVKKSRSESKASNVESNSNTIKRNGNISSQPPEVIETKKMAYAEKAPSVISKEENNRENTNTKPSRTKRALVIDDSLTIRKGIDRALSRLGFEVKQAANGMQGLKELKSTLFDIVLCDFLMPVMDGLDCVQQYREWERKHRTWFRQYIVGISAHATGTDGDRGLRVGMNKFISKPLPLKTLKDLSFSDEVKNTSNLLNQKFEETIKAQEKELKFFSQYLDSTVGGDDASCSSISIAEHTAGPACLVGEDLKSTYKVLIRYIEQRGWRPFIVKRGEEALKLLKLRNWEAVFLDDQMPYLSGSDCILQFRLWEAENRIARQNNVYLVSANYVPKEHSMFPDGFDGGLSKPFCLAHVSKILDSVARNLDKSHLLHS